MTSLEEKFTGDVAGLKKNMGQVAEVVNVDITPSRMHDHPFTAEIMAPPLPDKYRSPLIPPYDGRGDLGDHLEMYIGHMLLHGYAEEIICRAFRNDLTDFARRWFRTLKPSSISSWNERKEAFSLQFIGVKKYVPPKQNLTTIYQKPNESLKEWLAKYGEAVAATTNMIDREALMGAMSSIEKITPFKRDLNRKPPSTYKEFLARAQGYINAEEADANDPEHRFHDDVGHNTNDCTDLKDEIERVIREGRLQEFKAEQRPRNDGHGGQNDGRRREENRRPEDREPVGVIRTVLGGPYIGGDLRRSQKDYAHEAGWVYPERFRNLSTAKIAKYSSADVTFNEEDANGVHFPHNNALVVEAIIENHTVCRILVDNESLVDLLYADCLEKMEVPKEQLEKTSRPLYGFTRDSVIPQGTNRLPITAGEKLRHATTMANFVVIKGGSQYNAVIGRPTF
ncbi:hypothetical protein L484_001143 [Morus notabilis]|uniref:Retrotransposon gag domain-containing protein n=1 Tax=Morus notabilis TaxID=981085 RepID=W9R3L4_9ROSA|nr:hypothetical protein L484_001143 [Morus notabilis]